MSLNLDSGDANFTFDGIHGLGGDINGSQNIDVKNSVFASPLGIEGSTASNIVIENNDLTYSYTSGSGSPNGKIMLNESVSRSSGTAGSAITIKNLCDLGVNHTDMIQLEAGDSTVDIKGNYLYGPHGCASGGITSYDGGTSGVIIESNVVDIPRDWGIELYSDTSSIVRHNTVVWHNATYSSFGNGTGIIQANSKSGSPNGSGTHIYDNVGFAQIVSPNTGTADHNVDPSTVSYVGGTLGSSSTYADAMLASGSPGIGAADDGSDDGIQ